MTRRVLHRASTAPGRLVDIVLAGGRVDAVLPVGTAVPADDLVDLDGRPVLPGLVDHHIHLFAAAAALRSVDLSPDALGAAGGLAAALRAGRERQPTGWLRGVGYDVATSGSLDRSALDAIGVGPVRVQDRTGTLWVLDGRGLDAVLPTDPREWPEGVEQVDGRPTGVLRRLDHWLGHRIPGAGVDLAPVGRLLAASGVTAAMDAGADNDEGTLAALAAADLPVRVHAMTRAAEVRAEGVVLGPVKVLLDDADLPPLDALVERVDRAHAAGRTVAVHCVSEVQLALALASGIGSQDRVEHASLVADAALDPLVAAGPTLVLQPGLVATRGDRYLREVPAGDRAGLHRLASFARAGLRIAGSSDAPYGPIDPWTAIQAAVRRRTASGAPLGPDEALGWREALDLHLGPPDRPAVPRRLVAGADADLVVLDDAWSALAERPRVLMTAVDGEPTHGAWPTR